MWYGGDMGTGKGFGLRFARNREVLSSVVTSKRIRRFPSMPISYGFKEVLILAPIVGLLLVGVAIALQSGLAGDGAQHAKRCLASNFSQLLLRLAGYGVALLPMQRFIGIRMELRW